MWGKLIANMRAMQIEYYLSDLRNEEKIQIG